MGRIRSYLVGGLVLLLLAGCGGSFLLFGQREPWRREAELACLRAGSVKEGAGIARVAPISGPGVCGADYPLRVSALGHSHPAGWLGFAEELRPPAAIPGGRSAAAPPRWPVQEPATVAAPAPARTTPVAAPLRLHAPAPGTIAEEESIRTPFGVRLRPPEAVRPASTPQGLTRAVGPVELRPAATLACPIVSALDRWIAAAVQPAAQRWFGQPVVAVRQISAYACRGMNGNPRARISEHAYGNALDIAAFVLADGRQISVRRGWNGTPEEQGFLRDVQGAACEFFSTVLAPGSNRYHYDHIHVDLMRRTRNRGICQPNPVPGELIAERARRRGLYAGRSDPGITGSIQAASLGASATEEEDEDWVEHDGPRESVD